MYNKEHKNCIKDRELFPADQQESPAEQIWEEH